MIVVRFFRGIVQTFHHFWLKSLPSYQFDFNISLPHLQMCETS